MSNIFKIYQEGDRQVIERLTYPRFKGVLTFSSRLLEYLPVIGEVEMIDKTNDPSEMMLALNEAGDYLKTIKEDE